MTFPLSGTGLWSSALRYGDLEVSMKIAPELEELGYNALWIPDVGGNLFEVLEALLESTSSIVIATGILNLWMHEPEVTAERFHAFVETYGPRVLFGIGVSHAPLVNSVEPDQYRRPLAKTKAYLDALDAAEHPLPTSARVLAALGPKMLELSRDQAGGTHPYLVTPAHTAIAREAVGPDRLVAPEQGVVLETDPSRAREIARANLGIYLTLPNYSNNWLRLGFTEDDLLDGGSDRLVDALVVWGDESTIRARIDEHRDAGADHVCVQVMIDDPTSHPLDQWRRLAPVLNS